MKSKLTYPFRVGRKQGRAVLSSCGNLVVLFPIGMEEWAKEYCQMLNKKKLTDLGLF
jgi:hypothetical protein